MTCSPEEAEARARKVERFCDALIAASRKSGHTLSAVANGIERGNLDLSLVARSIGERSPSDETRRFIVRALRILVRGGSS